MDNDQEEVVIHRSPRGMPLLWTRRVNVPIITLENYEKWYNVFIVHPDDRVETVPVNVIRNVMKNDAYWTDHNIHPVLLRRIAEYYKGEVHSTALEVATGRWTLEIRDDSFFNPPF